MIKYQGKLSVTLIKLLTVDGWQMAIGFSPTAILN